MVDLLMAPEQTVSFKGQNGGVHADHDCNKVDETAILPAPSGAMVG
jgi:hypothetical protein